MSVKVTRTTMAAKGDKIVVTDRIEMSEGAITITCEEATRRHQGQDVRNIARMCLRGAALAKRFGGASRVPESQKETAIFAKKVGKAWAVPVSELNRVFLS